MYLLTSINLQELGYEIVLAKATKKECEKEYDEMQKRVWFYPDGSQKAFCDIYDDTRAKNAKIVTNKKAAELFGSKKALEMTVDLCMNNL